VAEDNKPFSMKRIVNWGDCDPAGMIYTPRAIDYAVEAIEEWYREVVGISWMHINFTMDTCLPTVRVECDFIHPPYPRTEIDMQVRVESLGKSSLTLLIDGLNDDGEPYFKVKLVTCFVSRSEFKPVDTPGDVRAPIAAYQAACGDT
jgi:4-hydroxybenzoyl-CoA thioesterase